MIQIVTKSKQKKKKIKVKFNIGSMKNNYLNSPFLSSLLKPITVLIFGVFLMLMGTASFAQNCTPPLAISITTYDADSVDTKDARVKVSGLTVNTYYVGMTRGATYTGTLTDAKIYSSLAPAGIIADTLSAPTAAEGASANKGRLYTVRVYKDATGSCYTDSTFVLPYVNYNTTPTYVDITVAITKDILGDAPLGTNSKVTIAVKNEGTQDATNVVYKVDFPAGLAFVSHTNLQGTYDPVLKTWTFLTVPAGATYSLELTFKINQRGILQVTAENTALDQIDYDSTPIANSNVEDDEGELCMTSHFDLCKNDTVTFKLNSAKYKGVIWERAELGTNVWTTITATTDDGTAYIAADSSLIIRKIGDYRYKKEKVTGVASCGIIACCPVKVIPGLDPILLKPNDQIICFGTPVAAFNSANSQMGYLPTANVTYGIVPVLPAFLPDQVSPTNPTKGNYKYQWSNFNGPENPTTTDIVGQDTLTLKANAFVNPVAVGKYKYKLTASMIGHETCRDTTSVTLIINELPVPKLTLPFSVCEDDSTGMKVVNVSVKPIDPASIVWTWTGPTSNAVLAANIKGVNKDSLFVPIAKIATHSGKYVVSASYSLNGLGCSAKDSTVLTVNPRPIKPIVTDTTYCVNDISKGLTALKQLNPAMHDGDSVYWFNGTWKKGDNPTSKTGFGYNVGPKPNTNVTAGGKFFYVTQKDSNGCQSDTAILNIQIYEKPVKPIVQDVAFCQMYPTQRLTAGTQTTSSVLVWYGVDKLGPFVEGPSYKNPDSALVRTYTYYVGQRNSDGCLSDTADFKVYIKSTPVKPVATDRKYCRGDVADPLNAILLPTATYLTYTYKGAPYKNPIIAPVPLTTVDGVEWAYVTQTTKHVTPGAKSPTDTLYCESDQQPIKTTVNPLPSASLIAVSAYCNGVTALNNGTLILNRFKDQDLVAYGLANPLTLGVAATLAPDGIIVKTLNNPTTRTEYAVRVTNIYTCVQDLKANLEPKVCECPGGYCEPATVARAK
jgi:uncharacterized repeat protein (TIGR01451 family)